MYKPIYINIHEYLFNIYYLDVNLKLNALFKIQLVDMQQVSIEIVIDSPQRLSPLSTVAYDISGALLIKKQIETPRVKDY